MSKETSKEQIVREQYEKMFGTQKYDGSVNRAMNFKYFSPAMDEYAKQQCIELLNWMFAGATETIPYPGPNMWTRDLSDEYKDSAALYEAFLLQNEH